MTKVSSIVDRYKKDSKKVIEALKHQKCIVGLSNADEIVQEIHQRGSLKYFKNKDIIIKEGDADQPLYFLIYGKVSLYVEGSGLLPYQRLANYTVGELSATQNLHKRTATVIADDDVVAVSLPDEIFNELLFKYPEMYKGLFQDVASRLLQRNDFLPTVNEKPKVFIMSSTEAMPIVASMLLELEFANFELIPWYSAGIFRAGNVTIDELKRQVDSCDFAVAVASPDDKTLSRKKLSPSVRDNVIFELGLFMGVLGKERAFLALNQQSSVRVPSDLEGVTPLRYSMNDSTPNVRTLAGHLSRRVDELGVRKKPKF